MMEEGPPIEKAHGVVGATLFRPHETICATRNNHACSESEQPQAIPVDDLTKVD